MVNEQEEHQLISAIHETGHSDVANAVVDVLNKRDSRFSEAITKISENTSLLREISVALERHVAEEHELLKNFIGAFPEGDTRGHRDAHNAWIERERKRAALRDAIIEKSLAGLFWLAISGVGVALWQYFVSHLRAN